MAGFLLDYTKKSQRQLDPKLFEGWLDHLVGWVEIDTLCTSKYTMALLEDVPTWMKLLERLAKSDNINKRRASLAFLVRPIGKSADERLAVTALRNIDRLKEKRSDHHTRDFMGAAKYDPYHRKAVVAYLQKNEKNLPAIAVRETRTKLTTGTKSGRVHATSTHRTSSRNGGEYDNAFLLPLSMIHNIHGFPTQRMVVCSC